MDLIALLLYILVGSLLLYAIWLGLGLVPLPGSMRQIIWVIIMIIFVVWIIRALAPGLALL